MMVYSSDFRGYNLEHVTLAFLGHCKLNRLV